MRRGCEDARRVPQSAPNIIVIIVDTLGADHLSCYGCKRQTSPFISQLAEQGLLFERAYSASSWTSPASVSINTSVYPFQHGVVTGFLATKRGQKLDSTITLNRIPDEKKDLSDQMETRVESMSRYLTEFESTCPRFEQESLDVTVDEKQMEKLESLAYVR